MAWRAYSATVAAAAAPAKIRKMEYTTEPSGIVVSFLYPLFHLIRFRGALFERDDRVIGAEQLTLPPIAGFPALLGVGEVIIVQQDANVARRGIWKWIALEQGRHRRRILQQPLQQVPEPPLGARIAQRREPHLPVQARLVREIPQRPPVEHAGLVLEFIFRPAD